MIIIPAKCPICGVDSRYESPTYNLYYCGTTAGLEAGKLEVSKPGEQCLQPGEIPFRG